jgi:hypothetical protein
MPTVKFNRQHVARNVITPSLQRKIDACPVAGSGLNAHLKTIFNAIRHNFDPDVAGNLLFNLSVERGHSSAVAESEVRSLIGKWDVPPSKSNKNEIQLPAPDLRKIRAVVASSTETLQTLSARSPDRSTLAILTRQIESSANCCPMRS